jgi:uncharacterized protein
MLIEFSVANYRSILERQTLSMVASTTKDREAQHSFPSGVKSAPHLLQSACVFGPNASGKTTLVMAMDFFSDFVLDSAKGSQEGEMIQYSPFRLKTSTRDEPSEFEAVFVHNGTQYQYGFSVDRDRVVEEWMFAVPKGKRTQKWFTRSFDQESEEYKWYVNPSIHGSRRLWQESTRDNALFFSTAVQLKSIVLKDPFEWMQKFFRVVGSTDRLTKSFSTIQCIEGGKKGTIIDFLKSVDIGISDMRFEEESFSVDALPSNLPDSLKKQLKQEFSESKVISVHSVHQLPGEDEVVFEFDEESAGTRALFTISGPWLDSLENGYVVVIDELHNSLHPHALRFLVSLFHDPEKNPRNAQLIFTSHDASILAGRFMHRDQIWLVEKDEKESSQLFPLSDFKPRDAESFEKGYLGGRYGAVPRLRDFIT